MIKPNTWVEEDRDEVVGSIVDGMIATMSFEHMRRTVWDMLYDDLVMQDWADLWAFAEEYAPEMLDDFQVKTAPSEDPSF